MAKKIKSISIYRNDILLKSKDNPELDQSCFLYQFSEYDKKGNIIKEEKYMEKDVLEERSIREYDEEGRVIAELYYIDEEEWSEKRTFKYNGDGQLEEIYEHYLDGSYDTITHHYNKEGKLIEKRYTDEDGELEERVIITFDGDKKVKEETFNEDGALSSSKTKEISNDGKLATTREWYPNDEEERIFKDFYKEDGIREISERYHNGKIVSRNSYEYNDKGLPTVIKEESRQSLSIIQLEYDNEGNLISQKEVDPNGNERSSFIRKYDNEGNILSIEALADPSGIGVNQQYSMEYKYTYFDE